MKPFRKWDYHDREELYGFLLYCAPFVYLILNKNCGC